MGGSIHIPQGTPPRYLRWQRRWSDMLTVHQALLSLVEARLPLAEGLLNLSQDDVPRSLAYTFYWLHDDIASGNSLSRAMGNQGNFFPSFCVNMVRAGEESGKLEDALKTLAGTIEQSLEFRRSSASRGYYLVSLLIVESYLIGLVAIFVIPQFEQIANSFGRDLNPVMRILLNIQGYGLLMAVAVALPVFWVALQRSTLKEGLLYRSTINLIGIAPFFRRLHMKCYVGDACAMASMLIGAGIPIHTALRSAGEASPSRPVCHLLYQLADRLEDGESLRRALVLEGSAAPPAMTALLGLSERSGQVPAGFQQVADLYRAQVRRGSHLLVEIGAPLGLCLVGFVVCAYYLGIFLSILQLPSLIPQ